MARRRAPPAPPDLRPLPELLAELRALDAQARESMDSLFALLAESGIHPAPDVRASTPKEPQHERIGDDMVKKIGWEDETVTGGFQKKNKEQQFRGQKGTKHVIRIPGEVVEYRVHKVEDVAEPKENGEPQAFNLNCAKVWDETAEEWAGDCLACERDYPISARYVCGLVLVGVQKGKNPNVQKIDAPNSVMFWDFAGTTYRKISDLVLELKRAVPPKPLKSVELVVTCEDDNFQKVNIGISQGAPLTTKDHIAAFKDEAPKLVEECAAAPKPDDMKRELKPRGKAAAATRKAAEEPAEDLAEGDPDDLGLEDDAPPAKPAKRPAAAVAKKPAAPAGKKAAAPAKKAAKPVEPEPEEEAEAEEEGAENIEDLLGELDGV